MEGGRVVEGRTVFWTTDSALPSENDDAISQVIFHLQLVKTNSSAERKEETLARYLPLLLYLNK